ncbi:hypothetical protein [Paracidovorax cattleyae]|uniref:Uncharacterized protein n=2 Tax=Paracidovorax cattleyae TaxID=80868 RepID=A0A1H0L0G3_9BURK|nr:hypothetical protein [Paracidovorax cattleyae]SDO61522.1 hypothetical protein SAMN04489708_1028 [Paracidovorax cattleyae]
MRGGAEFCLRRHGSVSTPLLFVGAVASIVLSQVKALAISGVVASLRRRLMPR